MWDNIIGHARQKEFLQHYLTAEERPHALLFAGAAGLGKKQLALEFAKALLCCKHTGSDFCESCRLMNVQDGKLNHPDFFLLQREEDEKTGRRKDISKEQILDLIGKAAFAPVLSSAKACIIEDADRMTAVAANAFLKLLEEPPAGWVFVLLATDENRMLTTIMSRVICLRFQPVELAQLEVFLQARGIPAQEAGALARIGEGSAGAALQLAQEDLWKWRRQALAFLEALPLELPLNFLAGRAWQQKNFERPPALLFVTLLQLLLRDLLMCKLDLEDNIYNCDEGSRLRVLAGGWSCEGLKRALASARETYSSLENSAGVRMALEAMALKIDQAYKE